MSVLPSCTKGFSLLLSLLAAGCGVSASNDSHVTGHFENSTQVTLETFKGKGVVVPEYARTKGLVFNYRLFQAEPDGWRIVDEALKAGVREIYVTAPNDASDLELVAAKAILKDKLGNRFAAVKFLELGNDPSASQPGRQDTADQTLWARDWAPMFAKGADGSLLALDFNYANGRSIDDAAPARLSKEAGATRVSVPMYLEPGNFMISGRGDCFVTDRIIHSNIADEVVGERLSRAQVEGMLRDYAGCKKVHIQPSYIDPTQHVDMYAKFLDDDTVLVSELWDKTVALEGGTMNQNQRSEDKKRLDAYAAEFAALGYKVIRVPQTLPFFSSFGGGFGTVWNYTNSLLVNGTAIVPRFGLRQFDSALQNEYEVAAKAAYEGAGYKVVFVDVSVLPELRGLIHCVTMQIPE